MPSTSKKQAHLMAAAAHNPAFAKKVGVPVSVAKEFNAADKGKKFGTGGDVNRTIGGQGMINKQRTRFGSTLGYEKNAPNINLNKYTGKKEGGTVATKKLFGGKETAAEEMKEAKALKSGKISKSQYVAGEKSEGHGAGAAKTASAIKSGKISPKQYAQAETMMKKGTKVKKMAFGGLPTQAAPQAAVGMANRPAMPAQAGGPGLTGLNQAAAMSGRDFSGMGRPAGVGAPAGVGRPMKKGGCAKPKKMAGGGLAAGHKSADGIATKGKTRGTQVAMKKGGKC